MLDKLGLDTASGHILIGLLLLVGAGVCSHYSIDGDLKGALIPLATLALRESLRNSNDGK